MSALLFEPDRTADWIETFLTIPNERGEVVPFKLFPQQRLMISEHTGRDLTVKGRQTRASSLILARNLRRLTTSFGLRCLIMTQDDQTTKLFRYRLEHHLKDLREHGLDYKLVANNKDEMVIGKDMQNHIIFGSGEERVAGRAYSAQIVHLSELAHWKPENAGELLGGITPAVPGPPVGWFDIESTPNGGDGQFFEYCADARDTEDILNRWRLHFYSWWIEPRYRAGPINQPDTDLQLPQNELEQLVHGFSPDNHEQFLMKDHGLSVYQLIWRRWRERELRKTGVPFLQEYVEDLDSCFITGEGNFFASNDGIDHLAYFKSETAGPAFRIDELPYRDANVPFYGPNLEVWQRPDPSGTYVIYIDQAEGGVGRDNDYTAVVVLNAYTRQHVATLRMKAAPSETGPMACAVGQFYNHALIGGERGTYGSATLERVMDLRYPKIYYHVDPGSRKDPEAWIYPTQEHRDEILRRFREAVYERRFHTRDANLVSEMGTFSWEKTRMGGPLKARAKKRKHDDLVIAAAGANYIAGRYHRIAMESQTQDSNQVLIIGPHGLVVGKEDPNTGGLPWPIL